MVFGKTTCYGVASSHLEHSDSLLDAIAVFDAVEWNCLLFRAGNLIYQSSRLGPDR